MAKNQQQQQDDAQCCSERGSQFRGPISLLARMMMKNSTLHGGVAIHVAGIGPVKANEASLPSLRARGPRAQSRAHNGEKKEYNAGLSTKEAAAQYTEEGAGEIERGTYPN